MKVLTCELSPVPPAHFDESCDMRIQAKAALKAKLQVEVSTRLTRSPDAIIIDGCALLWSVHWPVSGTVDEYAVNLMGIIGYHLRAGDVYLIFDRHLPGSTKQVTRPNRAGKDASKKHQLNLHTPLPAQCVLQQSTVDQADMPVFDGS